MLKRKTALRSKSPIKTQSKLKARKPMKSASPKTSKIRKSAQGEPCLVRVPGVCNGDSATTVLAHINGAGVGCKHSDHKAAFACSACHEWVDGGYIQQGYTRDTRDLWHLEGVLRTQDRLIEKGFIRVTGAAA